MATETEAARILAEYARRARELPADRYSWSTPASLFFHQGVVRTCIRALVSQGLFPLENLRIADIGCGTGTWLLEFLQWGAHPSLVAGVDLLPDRIATARTRIPAADLKVGNAATLPWPDASFDLVSQFTLFSSVLDSTMKRAIAAEMLRVLKPGGVVLWYDFRYDNPRNPHVRGVEAAEIRALFAPCRVRLARVTLAPPLARLAVPFSWTLSLWLEKIRWLRTHYLGLIVKPA